MANVRRERNNLASKKPLLKTGEAILNGDYSLAQPGRDCALEVRARGSQVLIGNSNRTICRALRPSPRPTRVFSTETAVSSTTELHGIDPRPGLSAVLALIFPERYTVLDFRTLEALGHARSPRPLLRGVLGLLQAPRRKQYRHCRKASFPLPRLCAVDRPRTVGVVAPSLPE